MDYSKFLLKGYVSPNDDEAIGENDSQSIQNAVKIAKECGIGKVVIPKYNKRTQSFVWTISKTILLSSNLTIVLDDCYMVMEDGVYENFFRTENIFRPCGTIDKKQFENIYITGVGNAVLDGGKPNGLCEYNHLKNGLPHIGFNSPIMLYNVRNFAIENISILNQRYWGMRLTYCKYGKISDIYICTMRDRNNQDGIDLRNGCNNILIENITAQTGDDTIALSGIDVVRTDKYNMVIDEWDNDIHDITIRDICGAALIHPLIAIRNHNGVKIYNVIIENVCDILPFKREEVPVCVQKGQSVTSTFICDVGETDHIEMCDYSKYPRYAMIHIGDKAYYAKRHSVMGETFNITVNNVNCRYSERAIVLGCELKNIYLNNITASGDCQAIISTCPQGINGGPHLKLENVFINAVSFKAEAEGETSAIYFGDMPEGEYIKNMRVCNVCTENASHLAVASQSVDMVIENVRNEHLQGEAVKIVTGSEESVHIEVK